MEGLTFRPQITVRQGVRRAARWSDLSTVCRRGWVRKSKQMQTTRVFAVAWQVKGKLELDDGYVTRLHEETQRRREQAEQQSRMREVSVYGRLHTVLHTRSHCARHVPPSRVPPRCKKSHLHGKTVTTTHRTLTGCRANCRAACRRRRSCRSARSSPPLTPCRTTSRSSSCARRPQLRSPSRPKYPPTAPPMAGGTGTRTTACMGCGQCTLESETPPALQVVLRAPLRLKGCRRRWFQGLTAGSYMGQ